MMKSCRPAGLEVRQRSNTRHHSSTRRCTVKRTTGGRMYEDWQEEWSPNRQKRRPALPGGESESWIRTRPRPKVIEAHTFSGDPTALVGAETYLYALADSPTINRMCRDEQMTGETRATRRCTVEAKSGTEGAGEGRRGREEASRMARVGSLPSYRTVTRSARGSRREVERTGENERAREQERKRGVGPSVVHPITKAVDSPICRLTRSPLDMLRLRCHLAGVDG